MRALLDSNVWRYVADHGNLLDIEEACEASGFKIVVAPALVFEARRLRDDVTRKKILALLAHPKWTRLMPEAFLEAEEFKAIVRRRRPNWLIAKPELAEVTQLRRDWEGADAGFWLRAQSDTEPPATDEILRGETEHELAVQESAEIRRRVHASQKKIPAASIRQIGGVPPKDTPGWDGTPVEYWRVPSLYHLRSELAVYSSPYREWIDSEVDVTAIEQDPTSLTELWFREIDAVDARRQWLRGAFEYLQAFFKVTTGTPVDSQLSSHLVDVDLVVSADRNFVRFAQKCFDDAPFAVAKAVSISGGAQGVTELLKLLRGVGVASDRPQMTTR